MLERSLGWYDTILPVGARERERQGYAGARWPKMTAPDGRDSPSSIGPLLIWQQPHPIFSRNFSTARARTRTTLVRYRNVVYESAEFMASYAPSTTANSSLHPRTASHPRAGKSPAARDLEPDVRIGILGLTASMSRSVARTPRLEARPEWDDVRQALALPVKDGVYLAHENCPQTYTERNRDHPSMLDALRRAARRRVDRETMRRTLKKVMKEWQWDDTWGWDYPMRR